MRTLLLFLFGAAGVMAVPDDDVFSEAFGKATRRHVEQVSADTRGEAGACYRVLQRLPACTAGEWTAFRKDLQPAAERVLRREGFTETSGYSLDLDGSNSIIRVIALKPQPVASPRIPAKRIQLIVTRSENGEIILSYEVRERS